MKEATYNYHHGNPIGIGFVEKRDVMNIYKFGLVGDGFTDIHRFSIKATSFEVAVRQAIESLDARYGARKWREI